MNAYAADLWGRAREALAVAEQTVAISPDAAASRAYYACLPEESYPHHLGSATLPA